jgi:hypothetical protein
MSPSVHLENKKAAAWSQGACRQDELIGGKPPIVVGKEPPFREDLSPEAEE